MLVQPVPRRHSNAHTRPRTAGLGPLTPLNPPPQHLPARPRYRSLGSHDFAPQPDPLPRPGAPAPHTLPKRSTAHRGLPPSHMASRHPYGKPPGGQEAQSQDAPQQQVEDELPALDIRGRVAAFENLAGAGAGPGAAGPSTSPRAQHGRTSPLPVRPHTSDPLSFSVAGSGEPSDGAEQDRREPSASESSSGRSSPVARANSAPRHRNASFHGNGLRPSSAASDQPAASVASHVAYNHAKLGPRSGPFGSSSFGAAASGSGGPSALRKSGSGTSLRELTAHSLAGANRTRSNSSASVGQGRSSSVTRGSCPASGTSTPRLGVKNIVSLHSGDGVGRTSMGHATRGSDGPAADPSLPSGPFPGSVRPSIKSLHMLDSSDDDHLSTLSLHPSLAPSPTTHSAPQSASHSPARGSPVMRPKLTTANSVSGAPSDIWASASSTGTDKPATGLEEFSARFGRRSTPASPTGSNLAGSRPFPSTPPRPSSATTTNTPSSSTPAASATPHASAHDGPPQLPARVTLQPPTPSRTAARLNAVTADLSERDRSVTTSSALAGPASIGTRGRSPPLPRTERPNRYHTGSGSPVSGPASSASAEARSRGFSPAGRPPPQLPPRKATPGSAAPQSMPNCPAAIPNSTAGTGSPTSTNPVTGVAPINYAPYVPSTRRQGSAPISGAAPPVLPPRAGSNASVSRSATDGSLNISAYAPGGILPSSSNAATTSSPVSSEALLHGYQPRTPGKSRFGVPLVAGSSAGAGLTPPVSAPAPPSPRVASAGAPPPPPPRPSTAALSASTGSTSTVGMAAPGATTTTNTATAALPPPPRHRTQTQTHHRGARSGPGSDPSSMRGASGHGKTPSTTFTSISLSDDASADLRHSLESEIGSYAASQSSASGSSHSSSGHSSLSGTTAPGNRNRALSAGPHGPGRGGPKRSWEAPNVPLPPPVRDPLRARPNQAMHVEKAHFGGMNAAHAPLRRACTPDPLARKRYEALFERSINAAAAKKAPSNLKCASDADKSVQRSSASGAITIPKSPKAGDPDSNGFARSMPDASEGDVQTSGGGVKALKGWFEDSQPPTSSSAPSKPENGGVTPKLWRAADSSAQAQKEQRLSPKMVRRIWRRSRLPDAILREVWDAAITGAPSSSEFPGLTLEQFVRAMAAIDAELLRRSTRRKARGARGGQNAASAISRANQNRGSATRLPTALQPVDRQRRVPPPVPPAPSSTATPARWS